MNHPRQYVLQLMYKPTYKRSACLRNLIILVTKTLTGIKNPLIHCQIRYLFITTANRIIIVLSEYLAGY
jgi:hypothetical protein